MPGVKKHHFSPRATDDAFVMVLELTAKSNEEEIKAFLETNGAIDVHVQEAEEGWWFGRYDREQKLYRTEELSVEGA